MTFLMMLVSTLIVATLVMRASGTQPYGWPRTFENNRDDDSIFNHEDNDDLGFLADQGTEEDLQRNDPSIRQWKWPAWSRTTTKLPKKRTTTKKPKVVSTTRSPQLPGCGTNNASSEIKQHKIVGGHKVSTKGKYPWMVAIMWKINNKWLHQCGGAIISNRHILTAAHCVPKSKKLLVQVDVKVRLGENTMDPGYTRSPSRRDVSVSAMFQHEDYDAYTITNDIAILQLNDKIENWTDMIRPICLATEPWILEGRMATIAGWGFMSESIREPSPFLMELDIPILELSVCEKYYSGTSYSIIKEQICAGHLKGGKDSCKGDSGGPLMLRKDPTKPWTVIGVVSWGFGCARKGVPGVYTRVESYYHWIQSKMAIE